MPARSIYLPQPLYDRLVRSGINLSAVVQRALREALGEPPDGGPVTTVFIEQDGLPIFIGRVGEDDSIRFERHKSTPTRVILSATDQSAFL